MKSQEILIMKQESDWKRFRSLIPMVRERYLAEQNAMLLKILTDPNRSETERFWDAFNRGKEVREILTDCLDGHSKSKMVLYIRLMLRARMMCQDDLVSFSDELQTHLKTEF